MGRFDDVVVVDTAGGTNSADDGSTSSEDIAAKQSARKVFRGGWGSVDTVKQQDSPYAQRVKVTGDPVLVRFLQDDPYAHYRQHWINERQGQKSFTCIDGVHEQGCPLCAAGHRPSARFAFNVALMTEEGPLLRSYEVGPRDIDSLKNFHNHPTQGPLSKHYWAISRTGSGPTSQRAHQMVRERDLAEEWPMIEALNDTSLEELRLKMYDESIIPIPSRKTLATIASEDLGA